MLGMFLAVGSPALAANAQVKLALTPVGQPGSYFDLTMRPGETRRLQVDIANAGEGGIVARTYASDVFTIVNGGFGARLRDAPRSGTTRWLDYPTAVMTLAGGESIRRYLDVSAPAGIGPGEYITSLVLENDQPIRGGGAVAVDQIVRQAIAVVVTVPGPRSPALTIGVATHKVVAGMSIVVIGVQNTGNVRLKPVVEFRLFDAAGAPVNDASLPMDSFYAHTATSVEVPLAWLLLPGRYTVRLALDDTITGAHADAAALAFVVEAPARNATARVAQRGATGVSQGSGAAQISIPLSVVLVASVVIGVAMALFVFVARRHRRTATS